MKRVLLTALLMSAAFAHAQTAPTAPPAPPASPSTPAKKELLQRLMVLQQPGIENLARNLVEQPAVQIMQFAGQAIQQLPTEKREPVGKGIEGAIKQYVDETVPSVRDRAIKLAPSSIGVAMEEKFSEDELKQLVAWLESPVNKKYAQLAPEMQTAFTQKLVAESRSFVEPRVQALEAKVRSSLGTGSAPAASGAPAKARPPAKRASGG